MKICMIGTGYVGLVTGTCFASLGNDVVCVDKDLKKLALLEKGAVPFYEPGLDEIIRSNHKNKRLSFTSNLKQAVIISNIVFIAVGTPPKKDGSPDISSVISVAKEIAEALKQSNGSGSFKIIVNKSTVPVGMGDIVTKIILKSGVKQSKFSVVSNPEFLREGSAVSDFMNPDRIVIGASENKGFNTITELYRPLNAHMIFTDVKTAEMIKYVSNSFLATKISFINEIANICEKIGVDVEGVANAVGMDKRIGRKFLNAGLGYGGSCLPKDVSALISLAKRNGYSPDLLSSVNDLNDLQADRFVEKMSKALKNLKGKKIALLGIAFKPDTDDIRLAPSMKIIKELKKLGVVISAFDPVLHHNNIPGVEMHKDVYSAVKGCDAMVIITEWPVFKQLNLDSVKQLLKRPYIFDGRNIFSPKIMKEHGFKYQGVGR